MSNTIDFKELITSGNRGKQPEDIKHMCLQKCKQYLGGVWSEVSIDSIIVTRINGGFTNQLYYCALPPEIKTKDDSPREVALRLYGKKHFNNENVENERLSDTIIAMFVSEYKLGPKILGLFETGQLMKYYKHHQFRIDDQQKPHLVKELAAKLAKIHSLNMPIKRKENLLIDILSGYSKAYDTSPMKQLVNESNCEALKKYDWFAETEWIKALIKKINSPIVFSHMDFRGSNVLVLETDDSAKEDNKLFLCDFEYSDYCYRGFDLGTIMQEWDRGLDELMALKQFPEQKCREFLEYYRSESIALRGKLYAESDTNSIETLMNETKVFYLVSTLFGLMMIINLEEELIGTKSQQINLVEQCLPLYQDMKTQFAHLIQL